MGSTEDPRTARTTVLSGPLAGPVVLGEQVRVAGQTIMLPKAVPGLAEFAMVAHAEQRAEALRPKLVQDLDRRGQLPFQPDEALVFEFLENAKTVVIMAIAGVEAFASHHILQQLGPDPAFNGRDPFEMTLDQRLAEVLPHLLSAPRPTKLRWWGDLRQAQGLAALIRHALNHKRTRNGLSGDRPINERLYRGEYRRSARMMLGVFEHFSPGWLPPERLAMLPQAP